MRVQRFYMVSSQYVKHRSVSFRYNPGMKSQLDPFVSKSHVEDFSGENHDNEVIDFLQHEDDPIDLSGAHLYQANLSGMDLRRADISFADLSYSDLSQADLRDAKLLEANLDHADLRAADLRGTDLSEIKLHHTKLTGAIFDTKTKMTIEKREAIYRGMVFLESDGEPDVVVTSGEDDYVSDQES